MVRFLIDENWQAMEEIDLNETRKDLSSRLPDYSIAEERNALSFSTGQGKHQRLNSAKTEDMTSPYSFATNNNETTPIGGKETAPIGKPYD